MNADMKIISSREACLEKAHQFKKTSKRQVRSKQLRGKQIERTKSLERGK